MNIGADESEIVLSIIFMILSKMLVPDEDPEVKLTQSKFQAQFSLIAINKAVDILKRNQERDVTEDELLEKYTLSISIVNFLKLATENDKT